MSDGKFTGFLDATPFIDKLGDGSQGLRAAGVRYDTDDLYDETDRPFVASSGPIQFSTSTTLARSPEVIWDNNRYYRDLGIGWPYRPAKGELKKAYQKVKGWKSDRITYCMKQLLNRKIRHEYDSMPLGELYRDDYVRAEEARNLKDVASEVSEEMGKTVTVQDLLNGAKLRRETEKILESSDGSATWEWGYYLLQTRIYEYESLPNWQSYLITAFNNLGLKKSISLGYAGNTDEPFVVIEHEGRDIFFINENVIPTLEIAEAAASHFISLLEKETQDDRTNSKSP